MAALENSADRPGIPWGLLALLTLAAVLLHGYHLGVQDQAIYLPAIKKNLNPALYPHDSDFFLSQTRWTWFDESVAAAVRLTGLPIDAVLLAAHLFSIFLMLLGCWRLSVKCFASGPERWGAVILVAAVLALPATGTGAPIVDNYVHARNFATVAILFALAAALERRPAAFLWLAAGAIIHPQMTAIGAVHIAIATLWTRGLPAGIFAAFLLPLAGLSADRAWMEILNTRPDLFPLRWAWYEWLGVFVPFGFLLWFSAQARAKQQGIAARISQRMVISTSLFIAGATVVSITPGLERLIPAQSMRGLHFAYLLFFFFLGGWLGGSFCGRKLWRWAAMLFPVCLAMSYWQFYSYPATPHLELPGRSSSNEWVQAFDWIKRNTPVDARFAMDPLYLKTAGNDSHGFRALAERSTMADYGKDRAVVVLTPSFAAPWLAQWRATESWRSFRPEDFDRLHTQYGVDWIILDATRSASFPCPLRLPHLAVCRLETVLSLPPIGVR